MKRNKRELTAVLLLLIATSILIFSVPKVLKVFLKTDYPLEVVISGSMIPTLQVGDLIIVEGGLNGESIRADETRGDIIIFPKPGNPEELIAHRAIEKIRGSEGFYFRTKGDNNPVPDRWLIFEGEVVGKVIGKIPLIGFLFTSLQTPVGFTLTLAILFFFMLSDLIDLSKEKERFRG
ncbi:signal peptidase I [Candidatus Bathyarchaeota archaeon]|nr:MAG: signal peptidase I [Candidatus Bathyarchaeota archaeon]